MIILGTAFVFIPLIIKAAYSGQNTLIVDWSSTDYLLYTGTVLSFIGSVFLGVVAIWQNIKQRQENERINSTILEQNNKIYIESKNNSVLPYISLTNVSYECKVKGFSNIFSMQIMDNNKDKKENNHEDNNDNTYTEYLPNEYNIEITDEKIIMESKELEIINNYKKISLNL